MISRQLLTGSLFLFFSLQLNSQVVINEFSSSNCSGITDEDGDHSDWIELYNPSSLASSLDGYFLSDDAGNIKKWTFPAISLKPHNYLLIFASGKDRTEIPLSHQIIIRKGAEWKYLVPTSDIGSSWRNTGFDASSWNTGPGGFGYGDNDDSTVLNNIQSVFIRKEFVITNLQDISELILSIDYDDGFVAYINGKEIARSNMGSAGSSVTYNQSASASREATMYSGGKPVSYLINDPANFLSQGTNILAIQGHNNGTASSDFSLIPMLSLGLRGADYTDDLPDYIQLNGNKLHTNFKISNEGETLILAKPDSSVTDSVSPVHLVADVSFGRKPDGEECWFYFPSPTPGSANVTKGDTAIALCDTVTFSKNGGYFPGGFSLQLYSEDPLDSIFYTIDGADPAPDKTFYTGPVPITKNTVVRAISVNRKKLPGAISTNTYITKRHTLPVICLSTNPENLWDYNTGIYVMGPDASTSYPYQGANFWQDWERKAHMELYDINGVKQIDQEIGIKIFGAFSRGHAQKSMALYARREYGKGSFDYKFFSDKPISKFESIVLRNGGNDWDQGIIRDGLTSTLIKDMDIDRTAFQPSILYLNGEYWGILNIREKINSNYIAENHYEDPGTVNLLEKNGVIIEGSNTGYTQITSFLNNNTLETGQKYQQVSSKIDINNYIQYQLTQIYINNKDWPGNNIKFWNTNDPGSLWRWIIYDTDFGFSLWDNSAYSFNTFDFALSTSGPNWPNPPWSTLLFRRMLTNPGFKNDFINQYSDRINTNFSAARINAVVDSIRQIFMPEISDHLTRWGLNYNNWLSNLSKISNYAYNRPSFALSHMKSALGLGDALQIKVDINSPGAGKVRVNSVVPDIYPFYGTYFKYLPIKLTAIPAPGYKFLKWEMGNTSSFQATIDYNMAAACNFRAVFTTAASTDIKILINEINYNSSPDKDTKDWVELYNGGSTSVNLRNWTLSDSGPETGFKITSDIILSPGMFVVICRDIEAFRVFFPDVKNITGDMNFGLSSTGDDINLYDSQGNLIDFVNFTPNSPWPTDANGTGASIELINAVLDNNMGSHWRSRSDGGTPGESNFLTDVNSTDENSTAGCSLSCFPNPFRDFTSIRIEVSKPGKYRLEVHDMQGRLVKTIADQNFEPGVYYIELGGRNSVNGILKGGVYIIKLTGPTRVCNLKVVCLD